MQDVELRRVRLVDIEGQWQELVRGSFHDSFLGVGEAYFGVSTLEEKLESLSRYERIPGMTIRAAFEGERLAGALFARLDGDRLILFDIFVAPEFRRRGIGRGLVELAARESGAATVEAEVNQANPASQALFRSLGFTVLRSSDWLVRRARAGG